MRQKGSREDRSQVCIETAYVCLFVYVCMRTCVCACTCVPVWRDIYLNDIYFSISGNALYSSNSKLHTSSQETRDLLKHCQCEVLKEGCKSFFFTLKTQLAIYRAEICFHTFQKCALKLLIGLTYIFSYHN